MGLHSGAAELREGDYFGTSVNRAARIMSIGHGSQVLLSAATYRLIQGALPEEVAFKDLGEVQLRGLNRPEYVYQLTAKDLPSDFPPLRTGAAVRGNLPAPLTSFIGREKERAEVARLLQETRLLTLTGPGGTGKTRLSLEVAADVEENYAQSAWLVELAPLSDPADVFTAVAATWNLGKGPNQTTQQMVTEYLRGKELLLILDNCKHLVEACAQLAAELLPAAPRLTILASSREGLGVPGEATYHLPTLPLPAPEEDEPQILLAHDSIRLFLDRAAAAKRGFQLTRENATAINHIVHRLDGIPLAIELAATRLRLMTPQQLADRLTDRFRLLTGGSRTALPRQQTLRALIDWSYSLLEPAEKVLFRRLSVFGGGWSLAAAEAVAQSAELTAYDALELLSRLVDKSLVVMEEDERQARFHYLETIRQYARDRLFEEGESAPALDSQLAYIADLALKEPVITQGDDLATSLRETSNTGYQEWTADLRRERDNVRSVMSWALETDPAAALELATALSLFTGGWPVETVQSWLSQAIDKVVALPPIGGDQDAERRLWLVRGAISLANMLVDQGALIEASPWASRAEEEARAQGLRHELAAALTIRTNIEFFLEQPQVYDTARETAAMYQALGSEINRTLPRLILADLAFRQGEKEQAKAVREEALATVAGTDVLAEAMSYGAAGSIAMWQGDLDTALALLTRAAAEFEKQGDFSFGYDIKGELGALKLRMGDLDGAEAILMPVLRRLSQRGNQIRLPSLLEYLAILAVEREQPAHAAQLFGAAEAMRERIDLPLLPYERDAYNAAVKMLGKQMGEERASAHWRAGRRLSNDDATELALSREQPPPYPD